MRTLFNPNILTATTPREIKASDPFELVFASNLSNTTTNSTASSLSRSPPASLLTSHLQDETTTTPVQADTQRLGSRRKGHSKLLLMGQRRYDLLQAADYADNPKEWQIVYTECDLSETSSCRDIIFRVDQFRQGFGNAVCLSNMCGAVLNSRSSFTSIETLELPSHMSLDSPDLDRKAVFNQLGAVVWVIDVQDEYLSSIASLVKTAAFLEENYPHVHLEVLIHKTDGLSDEYRYDASREVRQRVQDEFSDGGLAHHTVAFHQTSIFDHSIFEAMSKIVQKLLLQLDALEAMLNRLCSTCTMTKAFLFDTTSKLFIATDASPNSLADYEACSDYLDVMMDLKTLYSWNKTQQDPFRSAETSPSAEDNLSESVVSFEKSGDTYIYARELTEHISLICILSKGSGVGKRVLIDYNVSILQEAVGKVFSI